MSILFNIAIIVVLIILIVGYFIYKLLPTPMVGDQVEIIFKFNGGDLCGTETSVLSHIRANGDVIWRTPTGLGVRWLHVQNLRPRDGLSAGQCQWNRDMSVPTNPWNLKYWGDDKTNPTYTTPLKSVYSPSTWSKLKIKSSTDVSVSRAFLAFDVLKTRVGLL